MKISRKAITAIEKSEHAKRELTYQLKIHSTTLWRWLKVNEANGPLTEPDAVAIMKDVLDMSEEEILIGKKQVA